MSSDAMSQHPETRTHLRYDHTTQDTFRNDVHRALTRKYGIRTYKRNAITSRLIG